MIFSFPSFILSRKNIIYFFAVIFLLLLSGCKKSDAVAMRVGPVEVTETEFDRAFRSSRLPDNVDARRQFMEQFINQKLILLEAERRGLDKDPAFLEEIQAFWQQRLLTASMLNKFEEYDQVVRATEVEVERIYEETRGSKVLSGDPRQAKERIGQMIAEEKRNKLMNEWIDALRQRMIVYVDETRLGLNSEAFEKEAGDE